MRSLFKLSLASLAAVALFAGMAFAADMEKPTLAWSGNVGAGFGMYSYGDKASTPAASKAYSEWTTAWESNVRGRISAGDQFSALFRYRIRGYDSGSAPSSSPACVTDTSVVGSKTTAGTCTGFGGSNGFQGQPYSAYAAGGNDVYHEVHWKPVPALDIAMGKFEGQAWSNPLSGDYLIRNLIGDGEYWLNWTGITGIDVDFNAGVVQFGVAISDICRPGCGITAASASNTAKKETPETQQSLVPHLTGKVGPIAFRAQLPSTSGVMNCSAANSPTADCKKATDQVTSTGSGYQAGVQWGIPNISVAADVGSFTMGKNKSQTDDYSKSSTSLRLDAFGAMLHYFSATTKNFSTLSATQATITVRYYVPVGSAQIIPEYRTDTQNSGVKKAKDITNSEIRLVGNVNF